MGSSSLALDDSASHRAVLSMIGAVVPAWAAQSQDLDQMLGVFISALPSVPGHRRMGLMEALLRAVGVDWGLPRALLLLIRAHVEGRGAEEVEGENARLVTGAPCVFLDFFWFCF